MHEARIRLHPQAPAKPAVGAPCNGCGVCCALTTCPLARLRFLRARGPCPALSWSAPALRYHCGLLAHPRQYFPMLPVKFEGVARRLFARWISADSGCDCSARIAG